MAVKRKEEGGHHCSSDGNGNGNIKGNGNEENHKHYLAKCVLKSSAVLHAVSGHIRSPSTLDLVFGKETSLELVVLSEDGVVQSVCEQSVFGSIKDLKLLPWNENFRSSQPQINGKDLLVVLSDSGKLSFLTFSIEFHRFLAVSQIQLSKPGNSRRELGQLLSVDSRGSAVAVAAFEERIAVFPLSRTAGNNIVDKKIGYPSESVNALSCPEGSWNGAREVATSWGTIWSMAFVPNTNHITLKGTEDLVLAVILNRKGSTENDLCVLRCNVLENCISIITRYSLASPMCCHLAHQVLDVPSMPGFLLILRKGDMVLLDVNNPDNPHPASCISFSKNAINGMPRDQGNHEGDDEGSFNVAASALLELFNLDREGHGNAINESSKQESSDLEGEKNKSIEDVAFTSSMVCAWSWEPDYKDHPRVLIAMDTGDILMVQIIIRGFECEIVLSPLLYKCSPCKCLVWTKGGFITVFVEMGDGHVLKMDEDGVNCRSLIQSIAPILDFTLVDYHGEKQDQMFACAGVGNEGSLRVIRNGISVDKLLSTPPMFQGVTGIWTMHLHRGDAFHAFLVISFVEETRVLRVGLNFIDVTDSVGFEPHACTLACGLIDDGWVAQVFRSEVRICMPTTAAHQKGLACPFPLSSSWKPQGMTVSLGAVAFKTIILAMSQPGLLVMLGLRSTQNGMQEVYALQQCQLNAELSCIAIPQEEEPVPIPVPPSIVGLVETSLKDSPQCGIEVGKVCVVGTHKPSVELLSIVSGENFTVLAEGQISLVNTIGTAVTGCIPEAVRLVLFDHQYILCGLRNGMLLRFEWPASMASSFLGYTSPMDTTEASQTNKSSRRDCTWEPSTYAEIKNDSVDMTRECPVQLHLIAVRRVGISPVSLIPLQTSLRADIIALSDRPWLLQTARHSQRICYTSISFPPLTHATPVKCPECPNGIFFVSDCSLHLVEMEHSKRLNVQKFSLKSTPRRVVYHSETKTLLVMRTEYSEEFSGCISDICCVDPFSGTLISSFRFDYEEIPKCMQLWKHGNEELLIVGTGWTTGRAMIPSGEPESAKGRLLVFQLEPKRNSSNGLTFSSRASSVGASESPFSESLSHIPDNVTGKALETSVEEVERDEMRLSEGEGWELTHKYQANLPGVVLAVSPYMEHYVLASAGNSLSCLGFPSDSPQRFKRLDTVKTRFVITRITVHLNRIAVSDCRDGILFYSFQEDQCNLEQLYFDPMQRLVGDCVLMDVDTAMVSDRHGNICALSCANHSEESSNPEHNLSLCCWYHVGEIIMTIRKGSFAFRIATDDGLSSGSSSNVYPLHLIGSQIVASTLLGSVFVFVPLNREEYELLGAVQTRLALYPLTAPVLGNKHADYRSRGCPVGVCKVLDGDMLGQFLELTSTQQQAVLADQPGLGLESLNPVSSTSSSPESSQWSPPVEQVLRLLERVHSSLT